MPDVIIAVDWSSAQGRSLKPRSDRCWLAWATNDGYRSEAEYFPTRLEATERLIQLTERDHAGARVLIGLDFAMGYPLSETGYAVLPGGRLLCSQLDELITDDVRGYNNRFAVAAELNQRITLRTSRPSGPFWGCPAKQICEHLTLTRPSDTGVQRLRTVEKAFTTTFGGGSQPKSPWQLFGAGSVGGQTLVGMKCVHNLLRTLGDRGHLWPFETSPTRTDAVTIAEIYPSMFPECADSHTIKDARQVIGTSEALITDHRTPSWITMHNPSSEGWILGVQTEPN